MYINWEKKVSFLSTEINFITMETMYYNPPLLFIQHRGVPHIAMFMYGRLGHRPVYCTRAEW